MLRTRLVLGLLCLLVILLAMGLYSIDRCSRLGTQIRIILQENQQIIRSVQDIKRCITRSTAIFFVDGTGAGPKGMEDFEKTCSSFGEAIKRVHSSKPDKEMKKLAERLERIYKTYHENGRELLLLPEGREKERRQLAQKMAGISVTLLDTADEMMDLGQKAMESRNVQSGKEINTTIRLMILGMIIAIMVAIYASFRLSKGLIEPLSSLTASIQQIGEGNLDQSLAPLSNDELGLLARSFNKMATQLKVYREADKGQLARLNRTIQQTISSFPDPIFVLNQRHEVEFRNPSADTLAVKLLFAGVGRLPEKVETLVERVMESKQDYLPTLVKDAIRFQFDEREHFYMPRIILLREDSGITFGVAVILEDITQARLLDEVKTNLISTVSHELKTPITSLRMALYLLLEKEAEPLSKTQESLVKTAREDTERLLRTLDDLLDLTRLEEGPVDLQLEKISPIALMQSALQSVQEYTQDAASRISIEVAPDLPEVFVDRQRIAYVFNNLLTNALKYSPPGTNIHLKAHKLDDLWLEFSVANSGSPIPPQHLIRIFDKFYRAPGTKKTGSGLGLSIAREIVRAHQGHMSVTSDEKAGTIFRVRLGI